MLSGAQRLLGDLEQGKYCCNETCTAMLLGSIRGGLRRASLLSAVQDFDSDKHDLTGLCFEETFIAFKNIELPEWYSHSRSTVPHACELQYVLGMICIEAERFLLSSSAQPTSPQERSQRD